MERRKKIKSSLKKRIIMESNKEGCNKAELAKSYNIRPDLLYKWRNENKQELNKQARVASNNAKGMSNQFVEIRVNDVGDCEVKGQMLKLQKVSLEYDDLMISIDGKQSQRALARILEILALVGC